MKIFKLFIDENIKTWKKFSTKLAIFLIFLALIAALGMAKITQNLDAKNNGQTVYYEGNWKEDVEAEIKSYKEQLNNSSLSEFEKKQIENEVKYLKEGLEVILIFFEGEMLGIELPEKIDFVITKTEPGIKGNTATNATKDAIIETGMLVKVPLFIEQGEEIIVSTKDGKYVSRK